MKEIYLIRTKNTLRPAYASDLEVIEKLPYGELIKAKISMYRNVAFHRKFFALMNVAYENLPEQYNMSFENFREEIIKKAGHYESYFNFKGHRVWKAKSISFANMDQLEFEKLYSDVFDVILQVLKVTEEQMNKFLNFM